MAAKQLNGSGDLIQLATTNQETPRDPQQSLEGNPPLQTAPAATDLVTDQQVSHANGNRTVQQGTTQNPFLFAKLELAYKELQNTLDEAQKYKNANQLHQQHLRLHIESLQEDADTLASCQADTEENGNIVVELLMTAKRTRRQLERDLIDLQIEENNKRTPSVNTEGFDSVRSKSSTLKFTPIQLPTFDGNTAQFAIYRNFFEENILNNNDLTETAKWLRLKESLRGQAAELISEIPLTIGALRVAWKLLTDTYGGDERPVVDLYNKLQTLPQSSMTTDRLRITHGKLEGLIMSLEQLGQEVDGNHFVRWTYMGKFPSEILYQVQKIKSMPFSEIRRTIGEIISARECTDQQRAATQNRMEPARRNMQPQLRNDAVPTNKKPATFPRLLKCTFCEGQHWNDECAVYSTLEARKQKLVGKCHKCLRNAHNTPCIGGEKRCYHCDSTEHNRSLCPSKFGTSAQQSQLAIAPSIDDQNTGNFLTFTAKATSEFTDDIIDIRVLVDTAGCTSLLTREAVNKLRIPIKNTHSKQYTGLNDIPLTSSDTLQGQVQLLAPDGKLISIQAAMTHGSIPQVPTVNVEHFRSSNPQCSQYQIPPTGEGKQIDLLIGNDAMIDILKAEKINAINADTLLLPTHFGYLIVGRRRQQKQQVCQSMLVNSFHNPLQYLSDIDLVGFTGFDQTEIDEEEQAIQQFYTTVEFVDHRYSINWPWRTYPPQLDTNFGLALGRLKSLQRRLLRTPQLLSSYDEIIRNQLQEGIVEIVDTTKPTAPIVHYLPHHPILQPEKSTAVRPVIDASAKTSQKSKSLNDNIRKGTKWLNDLVATLLRFRRNRNVVVADIARAFHQIMINEADRDAARFLWLKDPQKAPTAENLLVLRFTRVAFGITASPFLLHAVIRHHANQQEPNDLLKIILRDMYADNLVTALEDTIEPKKFYEYAKQFFASMSMNLTKWATNISELQTFIPKEDQLPGKTHAILGVQWNLETEKLTLKKPKIYTETEVTPRIIAREMASWFDPHGWAAPIVLEAKIFFRLVWDQSKRWDESLKPQEVDTWKQIARNLKNIDQIQLPRKLTHLPNPKKWEIHTFVDASLEAYAVVVYLRTVENENAEINIVIAKSRLTPKKKITIPRLELMALILGCRLTEFVKTTLTCEHDMQTFIWSDSKCAISWMNQNKILPPLIEKHVNEAKKFKIDSIRYVPSEMNYADIASRGASFQTLQELNWWYGPRWLLKHEDWPRNDPIDIPATDTNLLFQTNVTLRNTQIQEDEIEGVAKLEIRRFSTLNRLLKTTAFVFKAVTKIRKSNFLKLQTDVDTQTALQWWIYWDQRRTYALQNEPEAGKIFNLRNISVFRDTNSIIRCQTRIRNSCYGLETNNPILLVKKSTLTKLIILDIHTKNFHSGTSHTLAGVRQKFWLPQGRREIYTTILQNCFICRKHKALPYPNPPPAPLPEFRVSRTDKPFQSIGLDICGPFYTKQKLEANQVKQKRWIIMFTCAVVRAIHLEVLQDMTTNEILTAFRRFSARRGVPAIIVSDNAPQFHILDGCFKNLWKEVSKSDNITNYMAEKKIVWSFVPEHSPWMGGMYERLIQSVKLALERTYGDIIMLDRQFEASVIEVEAVLNSRPITYVDRDVDGPILTPNDFLSAKYVSIPIDTVVTEKENNLSRIWKESQSYLDKFWKEWAEHYLVILRERNDQLPVNKRNAASTPEKGDIVVMMDLAKKRSSWQTAVVERRIPGKDGKIRAVQIKLPEGTRLIRPTISLAPLKLKMELPAVHDKQLTENRRAIVVWSPEGAAQAVQNPDEDYKNEAIEGEAVSEGSKGEVPGK